MDLLLLIGRVLYGGFFVVLGASYIKTGMRLSRMLAARRVRFAFPTVYAVAVLSLFGGLGIALGYRTNLALLAVILALALASVRMHDYWNASEPAEISIEMAHFLKNMALIGAALMAYSILVPWSYSL